MHSAVHVRIGWHRHTVFLGWLLMFAWTGLVMPSHATASDDPQATTVAHFTTVPHPGQQAPLNVVLFGQGTPGDWQISAHVEVPGEPFHFEHRVPEPFVHADWNPLPEAPRIRNFGSGVSVRSILVDRPYFSLMPEGPSGPSFRVALDLDRGVVQRARRSQAAVEVEIELTATDEFGAHYRATWIALNEVPSAANIETTHLIDVLNNDAAMLLSARTKIHVVATARLGGDRVGGGEGSGAFVVSPMNQPLVGVARVPMRVPSHGLYPVVLHATSVDLGQNTTEVHYYELGTHSAVVRSGAAAAARTIARNIQNSIDAASTARDEFRDAYNLSDAYPLMPVSGDPELQPPLPDDGDDDVDEDLDENLDENVDEHFDEGPSPTEAQLPDLSASFHSGLPRFTIVGQIRVQVAHIPPYSGTSPPPAATIFVPVADLEVCLFEDDPGGPIGSPLRADDDDLVACARTAQDGRFAISNVMLPTDDGLRRNDTEFYIAARTRGDRMPGGFIVRPGPGLGEVLFPNLADLVGTKVYHLKIPFIATDPKKNRSIGELNRLFVEDPLFETPGFVNTGTHEFNVLPSTSHSGFIGLTHTDNEPMGAVLNIFREAVLARDLWWAAGGPALETFEGESDFVRINWPVQTGAGNGTFMLPITPQGPQVLFFALSRFFIGSIPRLLSPGSIGARTDVAALTEGEITRLPDAWGREKFRAIMTAIAFSSRDDMINIVREEMLVQDEVGVVRHEYGHFVHIHTQGSSPVLNFYTDVDLWHAVAACKGNGGHGDGRPNTPQCAFAEGFADFWRVVSEDDPFGIPRARRRTEYRTNSGREVGLRCTGRPICAAATTQLSLEELERTPAGLFYEDRVAAALLDIVDGRDALGAEVADAREDQTTLIPDPTILGQNPLRARTERYTLIRRFGARRAGDWTSPVPLSELEHITRLLDVMRSVVDERHSILRGRMHTTPLNSVTDLLHAAAGRATPHHPAEPSVFANATEERAALLAARWNFIPVEVDQDAACRFGATEPQDDLIGFRRTESPLNDSMAFGTHAGAIVLPSRMPVATDGTLTVGGHDSVPTCYVARLEPIGGVGVSLEVAEDEIFLGAPFATVALENELGWVEASSGYAGAVARVRVESAASGSNEYRHNPALDTLIQPPDLDGGTGSPALLPPQDAFFGWELAVMDFDRDGDQDAFVSTFPNLGFGGAGGDPPPARALFFPQLSSSFLDWNAARSIELGSVVSRIDAALGLPADQHADEPRRSVPRDLIAWAEAQRPQLVVVFGGRTASLTALFSPGLPGDRVLAVHVHVIEATGQALLPGYPLGVMGAADRDMNGDGHPELILGVTDQTLVAAGSQIAGRVVPRLGGPYTPTGCSGTTACALLAHELKASFVPPVGVPVLRNPTPIVSALGLHVAADTPRFMSVREYLSPVDDTHTLFVSASAEFPPLPSDPLASVGLPEFFPHQGDPLNATYALSALSPLAVEPDGQGRLRQNEVEMLSVSGKGRLTGADHLAVTNAELRVGPPFGQVVEIRIGADEHSVSVPLEAPIFSEDELASGTFGWATAVAPHPEDGSPSAGRVWLVTEPATRWNPEEPTGAGVVWVRETR